MKTKMLVTAAVTLALLATMGIFAVATPDAVTLSGTPSVSGTVTARATVNPMIELTITTPNATQTVEFGAVNPETAHSRDVQLRVKSNRIFNLTTDMANQYSAIGLTTSLGDLSNQDRGVHSHTDTYSIFVPYTTAPGDYVATVRYTVTQQ